MATTTEQEAQTILSHLLTKLKDPECKYHERYAEWLNAQEELEKFLFRCVRPEVWRCLQTGCKKLDACKQVGGDTRYEGRGVYMDAILGLDKRVRIYVGQSFHLRTRIAQHWNFRYRRDNPSLHYHALQQSIFNSFGILATLPSATPGHQNHLFPGMDCPDLLLNILEMWMCLLFRSLPQQLLDEWLPVSSCKEESKEEESALNIASPLDTGSNNKREWLDLSTSTDPLIHDYLANSDRKRGEVDYAQRPSQQLAQRLLQDQAEEVRKAYVKGQKAHQKEMEAKKKKYGKSWKKEEQELVTPVGAVFLGMTIVAVATVFWFGGSKGGGKAQRPSWTW